MDKWKKGELYESYVGRWSRLVARSFLDWLRIKKKANWVDVGCGTGALTETILTMSSPASISALDASEGYLEHARHAIKSERVRFAVADARQIPFESASADAAVSGLVLNFVPEPMAMVCEMSRVVRPGGTVAVYVWDYAEKMELMRRFWDAAVALDPEASRPDEGKRFPICNPDALSALWREAGLEGVEVRGTDVATRFRNFDDYWEPFLAGEGPAPSYVIGLDESRRTALREKLRSTLPVNPDGEIDLIARAWAVRGTKKE